MLHLPLQITSPNPCQEKTITEIPIVYINDHVRMGRCNYYFRSCFTEILPMLNLNQWNATGGMTYHSSIVYDGLHGIKYNNRSGEYCEAIVPITPSYSPRIFVPCNNTFDRASYVCDMTQTERNLKSLNNSSRARIIERMDRECPYNWTLIAGKCVTVHSQSCKINETMSTREKLQMEADTDLTSFLDIIQITRNITQIPYKDRIAMRDTTYSKQKLNQWSYSMVRTFERNNVYRMCLDRHLHEMNLLYSVTVSA